MRAKKNSPVANLMLERQLRAAEAIALAVECRRPHEVSQHHIDAMIGGPLTPLDALRTAMGYSARIA